MRTINCQICGKKQKTKSNRRKYCGSKNILGDCAHVAWSLSKRWNMMMSRCYNKNDAAYKWYGGRGIGVSDGWMVRENYINDLKEDFIKHPELTIDRINNDEGYSRQNTRWITQAEQCVNSKQTVWITHNNKRLHQAEWARQLGISPIKIASRLKHGWSVAEALGFKKRKAQKKELKSDSMAINKTHYLGDLCFNKHRHDNKNTSLRYRSTRQCVICMKEYLRKKRENEKQKKA